MWRWFPPPGDPVATKTLATKFAAKFAPLLIEVDSETVTVWRSDQYDDEKAEAAANALSEALMAPSVTYNGACWRVWYKAAPTDLGDYNNPSSKWHY
jgi:hypothetical protein